jgi:hypothetical protein
MLIFSNRTIQAAVDPSALTRKFQPGSDAIGAVQVARSGASFQVSAVRPVLGDDDAMQLLVPLFQGTGRCSFTCMATTTHPRPASSDA